MFFLILKCLHHLQLFKKLHVSLKQLLTLFQSLHPHKTFNIILRNLIQLLNSLLFYTINLCKVNSKQPIFLLHHLCVHRSIKNNLKTVLCILNINLQLNLIYKLLNRIFLQSFEQVLFDFIL
jgi:hypothetical protein